MLNPSCSTTFGLDPAFVQINPSDPKSAEAKYASSNPSKRLGLPEEVSKVVAFLLSEDCSYINRWRPIQQLW